MGFDILPPWDANRWFQSPVETTNGLQPTAVNPLCLADPMRVGLIFAAPGANTANVSISINPITVISQGLGLQPGQFPIMITHHDFGVLTQAQWFGAAGGAGQKITVTELRLRDWPQPDPHRNVDVQDYLAEIADFIRGLRVNGNVPRGKNGTH